MPRKNEHGDLVKHTLLLYEGDWARLQQLYPAHGAGPIIRQIVHDFLKRVDPPVKDDEIAQLEVQL